MTQAEDICEHVVMIHQGRKVLDDQVAAIRRRYDPRTIRFEPLDAAADLAPLRSLTESSRSTSSMPAARRASISGSSRAPTPAPRSGGSPPP